MIEIKTNGMEEIQRALHNLTLTLSPNGMQKVYQRIGEHLVATTKQRFDDSVDPDGNKWAANTDSTISALLHKNRDKRYKYQKVLTKKGKSIADGHKKPLVDSGQLRDSIRYQVFNDGVVVGTNRDFGANGKQVSAAVHQFGSKDGKIPARPFLGISRDDKHHILTNVIQHIASAWQ